MIRRTPVVAALLLVVAAVTPAAATEDHYIGFACGFEEESRSGGATVTIDGTFQMGPWLVIGASSIDYHCHVQADDATAHLPGTAGHDGVAAAHTSGLAYVAEARQAATFTAPASSSLYLCTYVVMTGINGTETYAYDADHDRSNGVQCPLIT